MFKAEKTGTPCWRQAVDSKGVWVADLYEGDVGSWNIRNKKTGDYITKESFSSSGKAATWLWNHKELLADVYKEPEKIVPVEKVTNDLFSGFAKPKKV